MLCIWGVLSHFGSKGAQDLISTPFKTGVSVFVLLALPPYAIWITVEEIFYIIGFWYSIHKLNKEINKSYKILEEFQE